MKVLEVGSAGKTINTTASELCRIMTIRAILMLHFILLESFRNGGEMQTLWSSFIQKDENIPLVDFVYQSIQVTLVYDAKIDLKTPH